MIKITIIILLSVAFSSCQRELYFTDVPSSGTLKKNAGGDCLPSVLHGVYNTTNNTTADNYLEVSAEVKRAGLFTIVSDTVNGYSFSASGKFEKTGVNTVHMIAAGKPVAGGANVFSIKYDGSICKIAIIVDTAAIIPGLDTTSAVYTIGGSPNDCTAFTISGSYIADYALTNTANTVAIEVNVTTIGNYNISTTIINGIKFSASGSFTAIGVQTIYLRGSGTPLAGGTFTYAVSGGGHTCSFPLTVAPHGMFSFGGSPGICTPMLLEGVYKTGVSLTSANKVTIQIDVHSTGAYIISTDYQNGFSFFASGTFTTLGIQNIVLQATPSDPLAPGVFNYTPQPNISTCRFSVNVLP